jgi:hypothetical protein
MCYLAGPALQLLSAAEKTKGSAPQKVLVAQTKLAALLSLFGKEWEAEKMIRAVS